MKSFYNPGQNALKHVTKFRGHKKKKDFDNYKHVFYCGKYLKIKGSTKVGNVCSPYNKQRANFFSV